MLHEAFESPEHARMQIEALQSPEHARMLIEALQSPEHARILHTTLRGVQNRSYDYNIACMIFKGLAI